MESLHGIETAVLVNNGITQSLHGPDSAQLKEEWDTSIV